MISHPSYLAELRDWLHATAAQLLLARQFHPLVRVRVAADITSDAIALSRQIAHTGHRSEVYDLEAKREIAIARAAIEAALADGIQPSDAAAIRAALRHLGVAAREVHRSAEADHEISELAAVPA